jgi:hypothetical protein
MCLFAMMAASLSIKAQEVTITLFPGWNWISYPNSVAMGVNEALGTFTPMDGDKIKGQFSNSSYNNGYWRGGVTHFIPGMGYMYYSSRNEVTSFFFTTTSNSIVVTNTPTDITAISAVVGGTVTLTEGNHVFARGLCWGTDPLPNIDGNHTINATITGSLNDTLIELVPDITYYVRAYVVTDYGLAYGEEQSFTTLDNSSNGNAPEGAINGLFTINANGDQVYFSQGNLQYQASTNTWRFAENQQDIIGNANSNISPIYDGWIDLFGWGTSGYDNKYPWMTSEIETDYGDNQNNIAYTEYDWGQHNPISNGGNQAGLWRTLSSAELGYLVYQRNNADNLYAMGLVNGWHGLIILPDDCVLPEGIAFTPAYKDFTSTVNNFSLEQWSQMETVGAVFLPVAGVRQGTQVSQVDESGYYWSTDILSPEDGAHEMWFGRMYIYYNPGIGGSFSRHNGISVRLVQDAE